MGIGLSVFGFVIYYGLLLLLGVFFAWKLFTSKNTAKQILFTIGSLVCFLFVGLTLMPGKRDRKDVEQTFVGTYNLTKYPNCDSCEAILKEDNSFTVVSYKTTEKGKVLEKGNWHYVARGDFLGVYMDSTEKELLGSNRFDYDFRIDRSKKVIQSPNMGP